MLLLLLLLSVDIVGLMFFLTHLCYTLNSSVVTGDRKIYDAVIIVSPHSFLILHYISRLI